MYLHLIRIVDNLLGQNANVSFKLHNKNSLKKYSKRKGEK